jgi:hypothetical protein
MYDLVEVRVVRDLIAGRTLVISSHWEPPKWMCAEKCSALVFYLEFSMVVHHATSSVCHIHVQLDLLGHPD